MTRLIWSLEQDAILRRMWTEGYGPHDIARGTGATYQQVVDRRARLKLAKRSTSFVPLRRLRDVVPLSANDPAGEYPQIKGVSVARVRFLEGGPL